MKRTIFLLCLVSIIIGMGCDKESITDEQGSSAISGIVIDSMTQQPLDSVVLSLSDTSTPSSFYSDSIGAFKYVIFGGNVQRVFFQKTGYDTKFQDIDFSQNPTDIKIELVKQ